MKPHIFLMLTALLITKTASAATPCEDHLEPSQTAETKNYVADPGDFTVKLHEVENYAMKYWGELFLHGDAARIVKAAVIEIGKHYKEISIENLFMESDDWFQIRGIELNRDKTGFPSGGQQVRREEIPSPKDDRITLVYAYYATLPQKEAAKILDVLEKIATLKYGSLSDIYGSAHKMYEKWNTIKFLIENIRCSKTTDECSFHFAHAPRSAPFPTTYDPSSANYHPRALSRQKIFPTYFGYNYRRDLPVMIFQGKKILADLNDNSQFQKPTPEIKAKSDKGSLIYWPTRFE